MTATANSLSWNPLPTSISSDENDISLNYDINQNGIIIVQLFDANWNQIGQEFQSVSAGSGQVTLTLTPNSTPTSSNFLQAKLLDNNWSPLIETLQTSVSYASNSLEWNPMPTSVSSGANDITLDYSINQNGLVVVQLFNSSWNQIGQVFQNVSAGSGQVTLALTPSGAPSATNYLQAKLLDSSWQPLIPQLQVNVSGETTSDCTTLNGICKIYPDSENELLGGDNTYEANMYVSNEWTGSLTAFWGAPEGVFWVEWENNGSDSGHQAHEEFDYKALRASWTWYASDNGYPSKISQITDPSLSCTANGQWRAGSSGRCHINMTAWIYDYGGDGSRCDVIIHTWDNSGSFGAKFTGGRFTNLGTISDNGVTYDVLRTFPGGLGEKASYNLIPQNGRQTTPLAPFPTNTQYFNVNVKKILDALINLESWQGQTINSNWHLDGMEWTVTGQSGDESVGVPDSQGKWTFNSYDIPDIPSSSNKLETEIETMNFGISPNPFNHSFDIQYELTEAEAINIQLFTQAGKLIRVITNNEITDVGTYTQSVDTSDLPQGIYFIQMTTSQAHGVQKLVKM